MTSAPSNPSHTNRPQDESLERLLALVRPDMDKVDQLILSKAASHVDLIPTITEHLVASGGKRIRPLLTLASALCCGYEGDHHVTMAASIEFMHTATLLHDDVVDESELRRGQPTARMIWGNKASVLVGDFLLGQAFKMMVSTGRIEALACLAQASVTIAEGEVFQLIQAYSPESSEADYRRIIGAKTAALFIAAMDVGAILAESPPPVRKALSDYGHHIGMAFQIADDVMDYAQDEGLGKKSGDDFIEGKITLPVILALDEADQEARTFWLKSFEKETNRTTRLEEAIKRLHQTNALARCRQKAHEESQAAISALSVIKHNTLRQALSDVALFASQRCEGA